MSNEPEIPVSQGIPNVVHFAGIICLIGIFFILGLVVVTASAGHVWPATNSTTIKL